MGKEKYANDIETSLLLVYIIVQALGVGILPLLAILLDAKTS
jgi:hypothetical protein